MKSNTVPIEERTDHLGQVFESQSEMCRHWNIPMGTFSKRKKKGLSIERCLTKKEHKVINERIYEDHLGNKFDSIQEMCDHWNIPRDSYAYRIKSGKSIEYSLTAPLDKGDECVDHLGNVFRSVRQMCKHYNISKSAYRYRVESGWSLEKALTTPSQNKMEPVDHLGNRYDTIKDMCEKYEVSYSAFIQRIQKGWSLEKSLTYSRKFTDHEGNVFNSESEMCEYWGVSLSAYWGRYHVNGKSLEESLTTNPRETVDHLGNVFETRQKMCEYWNIPYQVLISRENMGWSLEKCLTTKITHPVRTKNGWKLLKIMYTANTERYYLCSKNGQEEVLTMNEIEGVV